MTSEGYILKTINNEIDRLKFQHDIWSEAARSLWRLAGIKEGMIGLDAGCGPGFCSMELANLVGETGKIVGFDETPAYLEHLATTAQNSKVMNISTVQGNLLSSNLPDGKFDFIFTRMVLIFISDLEYLLEEFYRILKPGGKLLISDFYCYRKSFLMSGNAPLFDNLLEIIEDDFKTRGADLEVCRRMPSLLPKMGFTIDSMEPILKFATSGSDTWKWPEVFFTNFIPDLEKRGKISSKEVAAFWQEWKQLTQDPTSAFLSPTFLNIAASKRG